MEVIDDASLADVDASLAELSALCDAKNLKSKFHRAGRQAMVMNRLRPEAEGSPRNKEVLRQAFKRAIKKASMAVVFRSPSQDPKGRILEDELSPSARILHSLEDSEYSFLTTSAEVKAAAKKELLMLGVHPPSPRQIGNDGTGSKPIFPRQKPQATITASYTLDDDFSLSMSMSPQGGKGSRGLSKDRRDGGNSNEDGSNRNTHSLGMDRATLGAKKQMVRALMLEMHLRELRGQGPLPTLSSGAGSASVPVSRVDRKSKASRVKTMPAMVGALALGAVSAKGQADMDPLTSWPLSPSGPSGNRAANTPESSQPTPSRAAASPFSMSSVSPPISTPPNDWRGHLKGGLPALAARHLNSLESLDADDGAQSPHHPHRGPRLQGHETARVPVAMKHFAGNLPKPGPLADSIRSAIGLPSVSSSVSKPSIGNRAGIGEDQAGLSVKMDVPKCRSIQ